MLHLIPMPNNIKVKEGTCFIFKERVLLKVASQLQGIETFIDGFMGIHTVKSEKEPHLEFIYDPFLAEETYSLKTETDSIKVWAGTYSGAFYALMTLRQLFLCDTSDRETLMCDMVEITKDCPKYAWRGLQLDESRHFFGKDTVKRLLDFMALYKLNRFHWHLTDDHGWRIEIKKYPLLTKIGSYRKSSQLHSWKCEETDNTPHFGFYTQEDIKEIIEYAKERCIEIIPEIDFPAHSAAALASYNNLACREIPCEVHNYFGGYIPEKMGIKDWNRTLCLGKDEVIDFVFDVIDEVADLFPFNYFHVGGDEAPTNEWKKCPACRKRIKDEHLKNEVNLQAWFTNKVNSHLKEKNKIMIGWNEILASKLTDTDIVAQYWTPKKDKNVITHLEKGGKVILSCHKQFYFDMLHSYCTPKGTYKFEPKTAKVKQKIADGVLGIEAEMWTEWTDSEKQLQFKLFPRGLALAESAWSNYKDYSFFTKRIYSHKKIMDKHGFYYGQDFLTMSKNKTYKKYLCKKHGLDARHQDSEFRLSELCD